MGTLCHTAMEIYMPKGKKRGPHPAKTFAKAYDKQIAEYGRMSIKVDDEWESARELGIAMFEHYVEHYKGDEEYEVIAPEQEFEIPILNEQGRKVATYVGVIDLVMKHRRTKEISLWDHKFVKSINTSYLAMDEQAGGYWTYGVDWLYDQGILLPSQELAGITFNFVRKAKPDDRPVNELGQRLNQDGSVSKNQPAPYFVRHTTWRGSYDREYMKHRTLEEVREINLARRGKLAILKTPGQFTCSMCGVRDICELHETGNDWEFAAKQLLVPKRKREKVEAIEYEHAH